MRWLRLALQVPLALLAFPIAPAARAETEVEALRSRVAELERAQQSTLAELDALRAEIRGEATSAAAASEPEPAEPDLDVLAPRSLASRIDFHGHVAVAYFGFEEANVNPGEPGSLAVNDLAPQSSFSLTDVSFFTGIQLHPRLYVATEVEFETGGDDVEIDQSFIEWDLFEEEELLALRLGKFYVPFGIERRFQNAPQNPLVDRPSPFLHIIPGTYSDTGLMLRGEHVLGEFPELVAGFELALLNGLGADLFDSTRDARQNRDNNANKAAAGRLGLRYDRWLEIGASYLRGEYDDSDEDDVYALGADLYATWGGFALRSEYVFSGADLPALVDANGVPCSDPTPGCAGLVAPITVLGGKLHRRGWYAEGSYRHQPAWAGVFRDLQYVARFDVLDEDDDVLDLLDVRRLALGMVARPFAPLRLKLQYELADEDTDEFDNNAVLLEGSVDW